MRRPRTRPVTSFPTNHPEFAVPKSDPGNIKFNHGLHMQPGQTVSWTKAQMEKLDPEAARPYAADGNGLADDAILRFIKDHAIDLLVIGEVGRGGLERLLFGDMAERLLPDVPCAVLAVKPADFKPPIRVAQQGSTG